MQTCALILDIVKVFFPLKIDGVSLIEKCKIHSIFTHTNWAVLISNENSGIKKKCRNVRETLVPRGVDDEEAGDFQLVRLEVLHLLAALFDRFHWDL